MSGTMVAGDDPRPIVQRADVLFAQQLDSGNRRVDRMFVVLLLLEWVAALATALLISPMVWAGESSRIPVRVALLLGGAIVSLPVALALARPGGVATRLIVTISQMLMGALLIHLTGGRIETHFHVFGSLAFLALYRDWRVLAVASVVVALDHFLRGVFWPYSLFGVLTASPWRWAEHTAWVLFEDVVLLLGIFHSLRVLREVARNRAEVETTRDQVERVVEDRTTELRQANAALERQVTHRERTEAELCKGHALLRAVLDGIPDAVFVKGLDGRYMLINEAGARSLGRAVGEVVGRTDAELFEPQSARETIENDHRILTCGVAETHESTETADGSTRVFLTTRSVYRDASGRVVGLIGLAHDITDRKRAEEALRGSEAEARMLALVAARSHNAVVITDAETRIEWVNNTFMRLSDRTLEELLGRTPGSVLHGPETDPATVAQMREWIRKGEGFQAEVLNYTKSGQKYLGPRRVPASPQRRG